MDLILFLPIISAIQASLLTALGNHLLTKKREKAKHDNGIKDTRIHLARAFWVEISALFEIYEMVKLQRWTNKGELIILNMVNIEYDYISIFASNADKIGIFDPADASEFVKFYVYTKAYIDTLRELGRRWKDHVYRYEKYLLDPHNMNVSRVYNISLQDLFYLYQICYKQQAEFYRRRDEVKKTFDKYL